MACYMHLRKHGLERPAHLYERDETRFRSLCRCGRPKHALGMCAACYYYHHRHGQPRPRWRWDRPDECRNPACRKPLAGERLVRKGLCGNCYAYRWRTGEGRPIEMTGGNRWCDCGRPATQCVPIKVGAFGKRENMSLKNETLWLCDDCAAYEQLQEAA